MSACKCNNPYCADCNGKSALFAERDALKARVAAMESWITEVRDVILTPLAMNDIPILSREAEGFGQATVALLKATR